MYHKHKNLHRLSFLKSSKSLCLAGGQVRLRGDVTGRCYEITSVVGTPILTLINTCLGSGCVPNAFKHAVVQPQNKNLDPSVLSNFRPVFKLPFLSKVLEKVVRMQLQDFLVQRDIHEKFLSGFKPCHSTETALLWTFDDLILTADSGNSAILVL